MTRITRAARLDESFTARPYTAVGITFQGTILMTARLLHFLRDETGATAIEYGLIAALVSVAAITALGLMGDSLVDIFNRVSDELSNAASNT